MQVARTSLATSDGQTEASNKWFVRDQSVTNNVRIPPGSTKGPDRSETAARSPSGSPRSTKGTLPKISEGSQSGWKNKLAGQTQGDNDRWRFGAAVDR
jgi:hypothetical protein